MTMGFPRDMDLITAIVLEIKLDQDSHMFNEN